MNSVIAEKTGIYAIENLYSRRVYVGATQRGFLARWATHVNGLIRRTSQNKKMAADAEQYGGCSFRFIVLQDLPDTIDLGPFEQFWIDYLRQLGVECYNLATSGKKKWKPRQPFIPAQYRYTVTTACKKLKVPESRMYRAIHGGVLPSIRIGGMFRLTEEMLKVFEVWWVAHRAQIRIEQRKQIKAQRVMPHSSTIEE